MVLEAQDIEYVQLFEPATEPQIAVLIHPSGYFGEFEKRVFTFILSHVFDWSSQGVSDSQMRLYTIINSAHKGLPINSRATC